MFVVSFNFFNNVPFGVRSGSYFSNDESEMSLLFTTEYTPRVIVRLVNMFNCLT